MGGFNGEGSQWLSVATPAKLGVILARGSGEIQADEYGKGLEILTSKLQIELKRRERVGQGFFQAAAGSGCQSKSS